MNAPRALGLLLSCSCLLACPGEEPEPSGESSTSSSEASGPAQTETETETGDGDGDSCSLVTAVTLERELASAQLPTPLPEMGQAELLVTMPSSIGNDDSIYLVADTQQAGTFTEQFMFLVIDLSEACGLNLPLDLFEMPPLPAAETTLVDLTSGDPVPLPLVEPEGNGLKVWDVTAVELEDPDCASSVQTSLSLSPELSPYRVLWSYTGMDEELRSLRLYAGRVAEVCI